MRGVPLGRWERSSSTGGRTCGGSLPSTPHVDPAALDVLPDESGVFELGVELIDALHELLDTSREGVEADPDGAILPGRFHDDGEIDVVRRVQPPSPDDGPEREANAVVQSPPSPWP